MKNKKTGILFGTFDILHKGHLNLFMQARKKCDYLITVIARDKTVRLVKKRKPINNENKRKRNIEKSNLSDLTVLGDLKDKFKAIKKFKLDIIFLGYDQKNFTDNLKKKLDESKINSKIIRLKPFQPEIYKTSKIVHRSAGAIIKNEKGEILMLDRKNIPFGWACPCGHVEEGENPEDALKREIKEETNLKIKKFRLVLHEYLDWNECKRGVRGHDFFIYEVLDWQGDIKKDDESKAIAWVSINELKNLKLEEAWKYIMNKLII